MASLEVTALSVALTAVAVGVTAGCGDVNAQLEELAQARRLSADLLVEFTKASDAANRAVMADTDESSMAFAREAAQAKEAVHRDIDALRPMLQDLHYNDEDRVLEEFVTRLASYEALDHDVLDLAVANTNLKAQRLSFGPAQQAADDFRDAVQTLSESVPARDAWQGRALAAGALEAVREIQALQAPHIAEPEDAGMARLEARMSSAETAARKALDALSTLVPSGSRSHLTAARTALDQFMKVNADILVLSHRNTNVRSLALSLTQKPALVGACEERLRALSDDLDKRGFGTARFDALAGRKERD